MPMALNCRVDAGGAEARARVVLAGMTTMDFSFGPPPLLDPPLQPASNANVTRANESSAFLITTPWERSPNFLQRKPTAGIAQKRCLVLGGADSWFGHLLAGPTGRKARPGTSVQIQSRSSSCLNHRYRS